MSSTEIFYHGTCYLFDRFSLSCSGSGEGKSKFGHGIYTTSICLMLFILFSSFAINTLFIQYIFK